MNKVGTAAAMLLCLVVVTGCWSRIELNEFSLASGVFIDKLGEQFEVSVQILDPNQLSRKSGGAGGAAPIFILTEKGESISEAFRRMSSTNPRRVYLGHIRVLIFSEQTAREGIKEVLDFFRRYYEVRPDFAIVVSKGSKAEEALALLTPLDKVSASEIYNSLESSEKLYSPVKLVRLDELVSTLSSKGKEAVLTALEVTGDAEAGKKMDHLKESTAPFRTKLLRLAVFKEDKLIGWLTENEGKVLNYLTKNVKLSAFVMGCPNGIGNMTYNVDKAKSKIKGSMKADIPQIDISMRIELNISEVNCQLDLESSQTIPELQRSVSADMEKLFISAIDDVKRKYKADIFGFGEVIHRSEPKIWKEIEDNWDEYYSKLQVQVNVDTMVRRIGSIQNTFPKEEKE